MSKPRKISDYPNRADDYDQAVSKSHVQNTDIALDEGGDNEVTAEQLRTHIDSTENPHGVTAGQVGAYTKQETDDLLDEKADQSELDATNQALSDLFTTDIEMSLATQGGVVGLEDNRPKIISRAGNIYTIDFQINVTSNAGESSNFIILSGITGLVNSQVLGHFFTTTDPIHTGFFYVGNQNSFGPGGILVYLEGNDGLLRTNHPILQPGVQWRGQLTFSRNI